MFSEKFIDDDLDTSLQPDYLSITQTTFHSMFLLNVSTLYKHNAVNKHVYTVGSINSLKNKSLKS